ncbi:MAG: Smt3-specific protease [Pycnora praestabilis]|nr:MAG: Smt3-specific protease [Pycnora praestabilis]
MDWKFDSPPILKRSFDSYSAGENVEQYSGHDHLVSRALTSDQSDKRLEAQPFDPLSNEAPSISPQPNHTDLHDVPVIQTHWGTLQTCARIVATCTYYTASTILTTGYSIGRYLYENAHTRAAVISTYTVAVNAGRGLRRRVKVHPPMATTPQQERLKILRNSIRPRRPSPLQNHRNSLRKSISPSSQTTTVKCLNSPPVQTATTEYEDPMEYLRPHIPENDELDKIVIRDRLAEKYQQEWDEDLGDSESLSYLETPHSTASEVPQGTEETESSSLSIPSAETSPFDPYPVDPPSHKFRGNDSIGCKITKTPKRVQWANSPQSGMPTTRVRKFVIGEKIDYIDSSDLSADLSLSPSLSPSRKRLAEINPNTIKFFSPQGRTVILQSSAGKPDTSAVLKPRERLFGHGEIRGGGMDDTDPVLARFRALLERRKSSSPLIAPTESAGTPAYDAPTSQNFGARRIPPHSPGSKFAKMLEQRENLLRRSLSIDPASESRRFEGNTDLGSSCGSDNSQERPQNQLGSSKDSALSRGSDIAQERQENDLSSTPASKASQELSDGTAVDAMQKELSLFSLSTRTRSARKKVAEEEERIRKEKERKRKEFEEEQAQKKVKEVAEQLARKAREAEEERKKRTGRIQSKENPIKELTLEWEEKVDAIMAMGFHATELAKTSMGTSLGRRDFGTILPGTGDRTGGWLNDEVVNGYIQAVVDYGLEKTGTQKRLGITPKYHAFNTFFYKNLREKGPSSVSRWASRAKIGGKDLLKVERIFIPVHEKSHWTLIVVSPMSRTIEYFDSLNGAPKRFIDHVKQWLRAELGAAYDEDTWSVLGSASPQQENGVDCGVFAATTAKMVMLGFDPMSYSQYDIPLQRRRMVAELLNGGFQGDFAL